MSLVSKHHDPFETVEEHILYVASLAEWVLSTQWKNPTARAEATRMLRNILKDNNQEIIRGGFNKTIDVELCNTCLTAIISARLKG